MKIARLQLEAFRGAPDGVYDFAPEGRASPLSAVVGGARSGRTSLLVAIAAAKEGVSPSRAPASPESLLRSGAERGKVDATWLLEPGEAELARTSDTLVTTSLSFSRASISADAPSGLRKLFSSFSCDDTTSKVELVPEEWSALASMRRVPESATLRAQRTSAQEDKYAWVAAALAGALLGEAVAVRGRLLEQGMVVEGEVPEPLDRIRAAMLAVAPHLRLGPMARGAGDPEPTFTTVDGGEALKWPSLSSSERRALALAVAAVHLGLSRSIILWDAPDRQLGARAYGEAISAFATVVPDAQLIVSLDGAEALGPGAHVVELGPKARS